MEHKKRNTTSQQKGKKQPDEKPQTPGKELQRRLDIYANRGKPGTSNGGDSSSTQKSSTPQDKTEEQKPKNNVTRSLEFLKKQLEAEQKAMAKATGGTDPKQTKKLEDEMGIDSQVLTGKTNPDEKSLKTETSDQH